MSSCWKTLFILSYCLLNSSFVVAQLTITYPIARMVVQRNQENKATLYVAGLFSVPVDRIEARLVPILATSRVYVDWTTVQERPQGGFFQGSIVAPAGSFRLEVRGLRNDKTVSSAFVSSVGIGEVFVIAGQSNAMGIPNLGAKGASERVVVFNAWNRFWNKDNALESSDKPFPTPVFSTLSATSLVFPTGETAWCWGELGDNLADRYNVPVAFFNVAIPATVAENWSNSAQGTPAKNIFNSTIWPFLQPYSNLRNTLQYYNSQFGIRAILWHHGESDAMPLHTPMDTYRQDIQFLIDRSRLDFGRTMTWVIARCSITPASPTPSPDIRQAQTLLTQTLGNYVWAGPDTDTIQSPRPTHGHFENSQNGIQGISEYATAWKKNLSDQFFRESQPHQPQQFIQTGLVPSEIPAGSFINVPYETIGYADHPEVVVQLLDSKGWFVAEVGRTKKNHAVQVYLPDTLRGGQYQFRVVATTPTLAGAPSLPFQLVPGNRPLNPFIDVQTEQDEATTHVHWLTTQEPAGSRFFIERRTDSELYESIGSVDALTDGQRSHLYSFTDTNQLVNQNSYRVRLERPDGLIQYSNRVVLGLDNKLFVQPALYPNPSDGTALTLKLPRSGQWTLTLTNAMGQMVWHKSVTAFINQPVTVSPGSDLTTGLYQLELQSAEYYFTKPVLIQH